MKIQYFPIEFHDFWMIFHHHSNSRFTNVGCKGALGDQHVYVKGLADALAALAEDQTFTKVRG